jgi:hypothetical protein
VSRKFTAVAAAEATLSHAASIGGIVWIARHTLAIGFSIR